MKFHSTLLCAILFVFSCKDDDLKTESFITKIEAFDVGNAGNSTDIRIRISLERNESMERLDIVIVPASERELSKKEALASNYIHSFSSFTTELDYSIRLSEIMDIDGHMVKEGKAYTIYAIAQSSSFNVLSPPSNTVVLSNTGILSGTYDFEAQVLWSHGGCSEITNRGTVDFTSTSDSTYHIDVEPADFTIYNILMTYRDGEISNFTMHGHLDIIIDCEAGIMTGNGSIKDDLQVALEVINQCCEFKGCEGTDLGQCSTAQFIFKRTVP